MLQSQLPPAACLYSPSPHSCCCDVFFAATQDKILQSMGRGQEVTVTNDGATILKAVYVDNPAAKVLQGVPWGQHQQQQQQQHHGSAQLAVHWLQCYMQPLPATS